MNNHRSLFYTEVKKNIQDYHLTKQFLFEPHRDKSVVAQRKKHFGLLTRYINNEEIQDWELAAFIKSLKNIALPGSCYKSTLFTHLMACVRKYEDLESNPNYGEHHYEAELACQLPEMIVDQIEYDHAKIMRDHPVTPDNLDVDTVFLESASPFCFMLPIWLLEDSEADTINLCDKNTGIALGVVKKNKSDLEIISNNANIKFIVGGCDDNRFKRITFKAPGASIYIKGYFAPNAHLSIYGDNEIGFVDQENISVVDLNLSSDHIFLNGNIKTQDVNLRAKKDINIDANIACRNFNSEHDDRFQVYPEASISAIGGKIHLIGNFLSNKIWCAGKISSDQNNGIYIETDGSCITGVLENQAPKLTECIKLTSQKRASIEGINPTFVATSFVNLFTNIKAQELSITSIADIDIMGFSQIHKEKHQAIGRLNLGMHIPNFSAINVLLNDALTIGEKKQSKTVLGELLAAEGMALLFGVVKYVLKFIFRRAGLVPNTILNTAILLWKLPEFREEYHKLTDKKKNLHIRDLIPFIVVVKNILLNIYNMEDTQLLNNELFAFDSEDAKDLFVGMTIESLEPFIPTYSNQSLITCNGPGLLLGGNITNDSVLDVSALNLHIVNNDIDKSIASVSANGIVANNILRNNNTCYSEDVLISDKLYLKSQNLKQGALGYILNNKQSVDIEQLSQKGFWQTETGQTTIHEHTNKGTYIQNSGSYSSDTLHNDGTFIVNNSKIDASKIDNRSNLDLNNNQIINNDIQAGPNANTHLADNNLQNNSIESDGSLEIKNSNITNEQIKLSQTSQTKIENSSINNQSMRLDGDFNARNTHLNNSKLELNASCHSELQQVDTQNLSFTSSGVLKTSNVTIHTDQAQFTNSLIVDKATAINANQLEFKADADIAADERLTLDSTVLNFNKDTHITNGILTIKSAQPSLSKAHIETNGLYADLENLPNPQDFFNGVADYENIKVKKGGIFSYTSKEPFRITDTLRDCDIAVIAPGITTETTTASKIKFFDEYYAFASQMKAHQAVERRRELQHKLTDQNFKGKVYLESTEGKDINFNSNVYAQNTLCVNSSGNINVNRRQDHVTGYQLASNKDIYMQAGGVVLNDAGSVKANDYLFISSGQGIHEQAYVEYLPARYRYVKDNRGYVEYRPCFVNHPAVFSSGKAENNEGVRLETDGPYTSKGSCVTSKGKINIFANGVNIEPEIRTYLQRDETSGSGFFGSKQEKEWNTQIFSAGFYALDDISIFSKGSFNTATAQFVPGQEGETKIIAHDDVKLYDVKGTLRKEMKATDFLSHAKSAEMQEFVVTSELYNPKHTTIISQAGNVEMRGVEIFGAGDLDVYANNKIFIDRTPLHFKSDYNSSGLSLGLFGFNVVGFNPQQQFSFPGSMLLQDVKQIDHANGIIENGLALYRTAGHTLESANSLLSSIKNKTMGQDFITQILPPIVSAGFSQESTHLYATMPGGGGISIGGNAKFKAGESVIFNNGVPINIGENAEIDAPQFIQRGMPLQAEFTHASNNATVSYGVTGYSGAINLNSSQSKQIQWDNQKFNVGGNLSLKNIKNWQQENAYSEISGNLKGVAIDFNSFNHLNSREFSSHSLTLNSNGDASLAQAKEKIGERNQGGLYVHGELPEEIFSNIHTVNAVIKRDKLVGLNCNKRIDQFEPAYFESESHYYALNNPFLVYKAAHETATHLQEMSKQISASSPQDFSLPETINEAVQLKTKTPQKQNNNNNIEDIQPEILQESYLLKASSGADLLSNHRSSDSYLLQSIIPFEKEINPMEAPTSNGIEQIVAGSQGSKDDSFMRYTQRFNSGIEACKHEIAENTVEFIHHPIEHTVTGYIDLATMAWDGLNAMSDAVIGISTSGSRNRNVERGKAILPKIDAIINGDGLDRTEVAAELGCKAIFSVAAHSLEETFFSKASTIAKDKAKHLQDYAIPEIKSAEYPVGKEKGFTLFSTFNSNKSTDYNLQSIHYPKRFGIFSYPTAEGRVNFFTGGDPDPSYSVNFR